MPSKNVLDEVSYALDAGRPVLPLLIEECEVHFRLRRIQYIDRQSEKPNGAKVSRMSSSATPLISGTRV
jgi:hypothetical protein